MKEVLLSTDFKDLKLYKRGKVRDVYDLGDKLLIVSCDRISCFDVVLPSGIPDKGRVLTALSCFWFEFLKGIVPTHIITADIHQYPPEIKKYSQELEGRSMLTIKAKPLPVECVVRGYLAGSGWKGYSQNQSLCGIKLPAGLAESAKLPRPIFTPSTKSDVGHDMNVDQKYVEEALGKEAAAKIAELSLKIYQQASHYADAKGIIIADTKFEFGISDNRIILIDEVLTPDSSRFWPKEEYKPGKHQISFDKQFVRDYLEGLGWDKNPPAPALPDQIIEKTTQRYLEAYKRLTGRGLQG